ncbi:MAG: RagB/SusD family nutrient uptake outer membrane protein [Pedobacter sp.]|uniref:RagB/SusD family nutrient uptake outer membrane protein n=1 Tax=Pedobacter sp. TaxID=1411316 RepID=UPI002807FBF3|nr:RagB/SusD family nutrient uptake outer membrane protein [Pedobacter sp.]MDQ8005173.1 RagB/SusD family nutrient uptake outer membrane protein [Pedobacter sp.]
MKRTILILIGVFVSIIFFSCKKYLTVNPKTQMPQHVLFTTEGGFKDALTGVYIQMRSDSTYGAALTQSTIEYLSSSWDITTNSTEQRLGLFNYADAGVETSFQRIWAQQFKTIGSINAILGQIDAKKDVFKTPGLYELIKSESLALRAHLHLDMLRLFGPVPTVTTAQPILPYVTTLSTAPNAKLSFTAFKDALYKDLTDAEALVKNIDPITQYSIAQLRTPGISSGYNPQDTYFAYRYLRMNYFAIKAIQARAYLWFNDNTKAYEAAKLVIDAKNSDASSKFNLGSAADMTTNKDFLLVKEHIFGLYDFAMYTKYTSLYPSGSLKKGTAITTITGQLFGTTGTDIRESNLWELLTLPNASKAYVTKKYLVTEIGDNKQIPIVRLSEMYLIAAEAAPFAEGLEYFRQFRVSRNIGQLAIPANAGALQTEIIKEYRKEFYAEGQGFYAYKRTNAPKGSFLFVPSTATVNYVVPVPTTEAL